MKILRNSIFFLLLICTESLPVIWACLKIPLTAYIPAILYRKTVAVEPIHGMIWPDDVLYVIQVAVYETIIFIIFNYITTSSMTLPAWHHHPFTRSHYSYLVLLIYIFSYSFYFYRHSFLILISLLLQMPSHKVSWLMYWDYSYNLIPHSIIIS